MYTVCRKSGGGGGGGVRGVGGGGGGEKGGNGTCVHFKFVIESEKRDQECEVMLETCYFTLEYS